MSRILYLSEAPRGVVTSTVSPFLWPDDRLADRRLVRELVLGRVGLGRADDVVLDRLLGVDVAQANVRADRDDVGRDLPLLDHARIAQLLLEPGDPVLEQHLVVLGVVVLGVLRDVAELAGNADALGDFAPPLGREVLDLLPSASCNPRE